MDSKGTEPDVYMYLFSHKLPSHPGIEPVENWSVHWFPYLCFMCMCVCVFSHLSGDKEAQTDFGITEGGLPWGPHFLNQESECMIWRSMCDLGHHRSGDLQLVASENLGEGKVTGTKKRQKAGFRVGRKKKDLGGIHIFNHWRLLWFFL